MYSDIKIKALLNKVESLEKYALGIEEENKALLAGVHPVHLASAGNLLHYLAIRSHDLGALQLDLSALAISSQGHAESSVLDNFKKIEYLLNALLGEKSKYTEGKYLDANKSAAILKSNSEAILGEVTFEGETKVMVTLPTEAGDDYDMVNSLVQAGMHIARINTAHDNAEIWAKMIANVKKASNDTGKAIKIYMDMEGPKIRTGEIKHKHHKHGKLKSKSPYIELQKGDTITLTKDNKKGHNGEHPTIPLKSPEIFGHVKPEETVWFDDGKFGGKVVSANDEEIVVQIAWAPEQGFKLKEERGVSFPDSLLNVPALTKDDIEHLTFIAQYADMVGFSFVQKPEDIIALQLHLKRMNREDMGIILKIETHLAFENFPSLLLAAMRSKNCGVMIARGDLAVAIGYLRIAEVQEEILWLAEAAHLPVVWATQVLETQIKKGIATRAEISDVVKAVRAECVMLNKGPFIVEAIETVRDIDKRMAAHEDKKRKILRSLHVAKSFVGALKAEAEGVVLG